jgi:hypothetical protein
LTEVRCGLDHLKHDFQIIISTHLNHSVKRLVSIETVASHSWHVAVKSSREMLNISHEQKGHSRTSDTGHHLAPTATNNINAGNPFFVNSVLRQSAVWAWG